MKNKNKKSFLTSLKKRVSSFFSNGEKTSDEEPPSSYAPDLGVLQDKLDVFFQTIISQVMVPRTKMITLDSSDNLSEAIAIINEKGHSRIPVIEGNPDNIVGILYAKDIFKVMEEMETHSVASLIRKPLFVSYSQPIYQVLAQFKASRTHIAIVIDEYGGVDGMLTVEDVIEELVGELNDEHDVPQNPMLDTVGDTTTVSAEYPLEKFNERYKTNFEKEGIETIGGYVCHLTGHIPKVNEILFLPPFQIKIIEGDERRIYKVSILPAKTSSAPSLEK